MTIADQHHLTQPSSLQPVMDNLSSWASNQALQLNPIKCKVVHVNFSHNPLHPAPLGLNDHHLEVVPSVKVLGLWVQGHLKWDQQVNQMLSIANWRLHVLHRLRCFKWAEKILWLSSKHATRHLLSIVLQCGTPLCLSANQISWRKSKKRPCRIILGLEYNHYVPSLITLGICQREVKNCAGDMLCMSKSPSWENSSNGSVSGCSIKHSSKLQAIQIRTVYHRNSAINYLNYTI